MDQEILNLKIEGKSLRQISKVVGISHVAVAKRLKRLSTRNGEVLTSKSPSHTIGQNVNSLDSPPQERPGEAKKAFPGMILEGGDLFQEIKKFLEERGIDVYRIKAGPEAYQVERGDQVIRFYVQRIFKGDRTNGKKE